MLAPEQPIMEERRGCDMKEEIDMGMRTGPTDDCGAAGKHHRCRLRSLLPSPPSLPHLQPLMNGKTLSRMLVAARKRGEDYGMSGTKKRALIPRGCGQYRGGDITSFGWGEAVGIGIT